MKSLLVIEDDPMMRSVIADIFEGRGFEVIQAENGYEGLILTATRRFDAVLTDVDMPVKSGIEFLTEFRKSNSETPVIVMTGGVITEEESFRAGASGFITKPFRDIESLVRKVAV